MAGLMMHQITMMREVK